MYYGSRLFNGYNLADKPEQATQLCALVANPDHTVIQDRELLPTPLIQLDLK